MKVLIDINHPAHVHYFRNFFKLMTQMGHEIMFVSRNKEIEHTLLDSYNIPYIDRGKGKNGKFSKFLYLLYADVKIWAIARKFKPDVFLNFLHPYPSQVANFLRKTSLVFSDTEHASLHHKLTVPYASKIFTPACYSLDLGKKQCRFNSYMEVAYLHPNYFKPDPAVLEMLGVKETEKFVIVRFVSWAAVHDFGQAGITMENKRRTVQELSRHAKVFISSEGELPEDLEKHRIRIPFHKMHDALYYSALLFGESGTMASEAAILGTPAIFLNSNRLGYLDEQEKKYALVFNFRESAQDQESAIQKALTIIQEENGKEKYRRQSQHLLDECIDTTQFMVNEVLKYDKQPASADV
ncbi:DUF354 domain-containing protein [Adhaeribacter sp. BT258]|uniref:DUF354 domain-containing protein n=1 Tax=Adhaeribacter terrigena TaxID=2793070 RepID=A0ABS1BYB5_9BACT|nr:DUF354 domain-containing protein [Adhaeribacter terrigena]MBK0401916.1 DUF354 domain-containing protein [Adhaeribacter terrigena]